MTPEEIQERIEELDRDIPKESAEVVIFCEEESQDCEVIGNRAGYLRLGVEMLKAAIAPLGSGEMFTPVSVDYLLTSPRGLGVKRFTRLDDVQSALPPLSNDVENQGSGYWMSTSRYLHGCLHARGLWAGFHVAVSLNAVTGDFTQNRRPKVTE